MSDLIPEVLDLLVPGVPLAAHVGLRGVELVCTSPGADWRTRCARESPCSG